MSRWSAPQWRVASSAGAALVVGFLTWRYVEGETARAGQHVSMGSVLVIRKSLSAGAAISPASLETRQMPVAFLEPGALREVNDLKSIPGARARLALVKGEQLTRSKIESESSRLGVAWAIPPGLVAVAVRLSPEEAVAGQVLPGDWVAVLGGATRAAPLTTMIPRARVVAVNERLWELNAAPPSPPTGVSANEFFLVTLLLTPGQAMRVASASEHGHLALALLSSLEDGARRAESS